MKGGSFMANTEIFLRNIFGTTRPNIRPLVLALNITNDLLFEQHISMSDIKATKHIYPDVARLLHKKPETVYKSVIRLAHRCWDALVEQDLVLSYLGRSMKQEPDPSVFITYLAVYIQSDIPFLNSLSVTLVFFSETRLTYSECLIFRLNRLQSCCATNRSWFLKQWLLHPRPD